MVDDGAISDVPTIGSAVRAARIAAGLSVSELARRVGVSQPYVSQIESGRHSPSTTTLYKLAEELHVTTAALLPSAGAQGESTLIRRGGGTPVPFNGASHRLDAKHLGRGGDSVLSPLRFELPAGYRDPEPYVHAGEIFMFVIDGKLTVDLGSERLELGPGDTLHHDAREPHSWIVGDDAGVELLFVETTSRFPAVAVHEDETPGQFSSHR